MDLALFNVLEPALAPIVTAVVTALGVMVRQAWQRRGSHVQLNRQLAAATAEVAFIREWAAARSSVGDGSDADRADLAAATEDLRRIYAKAFAEVGQAEQSAPDAMPVFEPAEAWNTAVALRPRTRQWDTRTGAVVTGYRKPRGAARWVRPLYWLALVWAVFVAAALFMGFMDETGDGVGAVVGSLVGATITTLVLGVLPAAAIRVAVLELDERATGTPDPRTAADRVPAPGSVVPGPRAPGASAPGVGQVPAKHW